MKIEGFFNPRSTFGESSKLRGPSWGSNFMGKLLRFQTA